MNLACNEMPNPVGFFGALGMAGFGLTDIATVCGCGAEAIRRYLATNPTEGFAYWSGARGYEGPGGKVAAYRLGLAEVDTDALIVAGILYLGQSTDREALDCLARVACRLALEGAPDVRAVMAAIDQFGERPHG